MTAAPGAKAARRAAWLLAFALPLAMSAGAAAPKREPDPVLTQLLMAAVADSQSFRNEYVAQVWLLDMSTRLAPMMPDPAARLELLRAVHHEATRAGLSPNLVLAVIQVESAFQRFAISSAGARGLMQIMPFWLEEVGQPEANLFQVRTNLRFGCTILKYYLDMAGGDLFEALARYNGSYGWSTEYPERVFRALDRRWFVQ